MVTTKRKVEMPAGIRNKLMAAVAMLLVATILMVSSTYAWFTLSTAPEVTGISTSVGANGNLEIALLTTETFGTPELIRSAVGDSSAHQAVTASNITWGNLVDLSSTDYALNTINLLPAKANITSATTTDTNEEEVTVYTLNTGNMLQTPVYGADGRVAELENKTVSAIFANSKFEYDSAAGQTYGVRAVGIASNMSVAQQAFASAKGSFNSSRSSAAKALASAVNANSTQFMIIAMTGDTPTKYSAADVQALIGMTNGAKSSLQSIVKAYANAGLAYAAAANPEEDVLAVLQAQIKGVTDAATLKGKLNDADVHQYDTELDGLATQQINVNNALETFAAYKDSGVAETETAALDAVNAAFNKLYTDVKIYKADGAELTTEQAKTDMSSIDSVYVDGGAIGAIADQTGNSLLTTMMGIKVYSGSKTAEANALAAVSTALNGLTPPAGAATSLIEDTYGYVIDFAFRSNAAESYLQLQTDGVNRVYSDETSAELATQGGGSTVTFHFTEGMTVTQATKLLEAFDIVFFDPEDGTVYAQARLNTITPNEAQTELTAKVGLVGIEADYINYTFGKDAYTAVEGEEDQYALNYNETTDDGVTTCTVTWGGTAHGLHDLISDPAERTITKAAYDALAPQTVISGTTREYAPLADPDNIVALEQNTVKKVSVLVYLNGDLIDNSGTINADTSGSIDLNLQFSSSATLTPMSNSALRAMTAS